LFVLSDVYPMADTTLARFEAAAAGTPFGRERRAAVTLTTDRLVLSTDQDDPVTVPLERVFDFVVRMPDDATDDRELVLGTSFDDQQGVVVVRAPADTVDRVAPLLAKGLLNGSPCAVRRGESRVTGRLSVQRQGVAFETEGRPVRLRYDSIDRLSRDGEAVVVGTDDASITVTFDEPRLRNLFVRHLRTTPAVALSSAKRPTVLVVDDEPNLADLVAHKLSSLTDGYDYVALDDPEEAFRTAVGGEVDCVVSDYAMPHIDGLELLRRIRDHDPGLPFILFTGRGSESVATEAIDAGVTDYVPKSMGDEGYARLARRIEAVV
jgi:CheY-like chemotaxis protein